MDAPVLDVTSGPRLTVRSRPKAELVALALLIIGPLLVFTLAAAFGHTIMLRDDLDQNYPLRVLVGRQLRAGQLPLINPYIWSGAPLLAGWNAGAAYPFTWLFAVLPGTAAWVANEVLTFWTAGLGLYAFLRVKRIGPVGAFLGALAFTAGGSFAIQTEHFGLVAGMSWVPLSLLALDRLARPGTPGRIAGWVALFGVSGALCVLAGEPRAIDDAAVILGGYALWLLVRSGRLWWRYLLLVGAAAFLAMAISAVQWLPGVHAVSESQRSVATYDLFISGSLHIPWLALITVPILLGGSGSYRLPGFLAGYNLPEIAYYIGLFPLVGLVSMFGTLRRGRGVPEWLIWPILAGVGLLLALGGHTPLGPLLYHVPLFGSQRLQSRNVMITDLALAVIFAYWVDRWLSERRRAHLLGLIPIGIAAFFCIFGLVAPGVFAPALGVADAGAQIAQLRPLYAAYLGIAVLTAACLIGGMYLPKRRRAGLLAVVLAVDLAFTASTVMAYVNTKAPGGHDSIVDAAGSATRAAPLRIPLSSIGRDGRYLVYGPDGVASYDMGGIGITDINVMHETYSMQGYSAIVDGKYAAGTGTHQDEGQGHNTVSLGVVGDGTLDQLNARYLMTLPRYLLSNPAVESSDPQPRSVAAGTQSGWFLGQVFDLRSVQVPVSSGRVRVGVLLADGATRWLTGGRVERPVSAVGVVVQAQGGAATVRSPSVTTTGGTRLVADGALQQALAAHHWRFVGNLGDGYAAFTNPTVTPMLTVQGSGATVTRRAGDPLLPTSATVSSRSGAVVVRAVADTPGWSASWRPADGSAGRSLPVQRHGLVQAVSVPGGTGVLTWHYDPPGFTVGGWLSIIGLAGLVLTVGYVVFDRRRRGALVGQQADDAVR